MEDLGSSGLAVYTSCRVRRHYLVSGQPDCPRRSWLPSMLWRLPNVMTPTAAMKPIFSAFGASTTSDSVLQPFKRSRKRFIDCSMYTSPLYLGQALGCRDQTGDAEAVPRHRSTNFCLAETTSSATRVVQPLRYAVANFTASSTLSDVEMKTSIHSRCSTNPRGKGRSWRPTLYPPLQFALVRDGADRGPGRRPSTRSSSITAAPADAATAAPIRRGGGRAAQTRQPGLTGAIGIAVRVECFGTTCWNDVHPGCWEKPHRPAQPRTDGIYRCSTPDLLVLFDLLRI